MAKRRLSKNQTRRLKSNQKASIARARGDQDTISDETLGPEQEGLLIATYGAQAEVEDSSSGQLIRCHLRANITPPVAGDKVIWREGKDIGVIVSVLPRSSELNRPDSYGNLKTVAANVDQMLITIACKPEPFPNLIDRYLVAAELQTLTPIIIINKTELLEEFARDHIFKISSTYEKLGYQVIYVSAHTKAGIPSLEEQLTNKISIFVGQSGVGKSSLVNSLVPDLDIKVGDLSHSIAKGKHTTTHSQLFHFPKGGSFIDSPGIREFGLWHIDKDNVIDGFVDLRQHADQCKFRNCSHTNEPGCAIKAAIKSNAISQDRFDSYLRILSTIDDVEIKNKSNK